MARTRSTTTRRRARRSPSPVRPRPYASSFYRPRAAPSARGFLFGIHPESRRTASPRVILILCLAAPTNHTAHQRLRVFLDAAQMLFADEAFGVDLVDVLGAGGAGGEPAVLRHDLDAADGFVVAGGFREFGGHRIACEVFRIEAVAVE